MVKNEYGKQYITAVGLQRTIAGTGNLAEDWLSGDLTAMHK